MKRKKRCSEKDRGMKGWKVKVNVGDDVIRKSGESTKKKVKREEIKGMERTEHIGRKK